MSQFQKPKLFPALIGFLVQSPGVDSSLGELASNYLTIKFQQSSPNKTVNEGLDDHLINSLWEVSRTLGHNQFEKLKVYYIKFDFSHLISSRHCYPSFQFQIIQLQIILFINIIIMNKIFPINSHFSPFFVKILAYKISVYEGISPSLLATMSLSQGVKGNTNEELINSLVKSNVIRNKTLQTAMKKVDRKHFISQEFLKKNENIYQNKPHKISGGQNMTDIFTHAVILEEVCFHIEQLIAEKKMIQNTLKVLDIGTGHGYLAFVLSLYLAETLKLNNLKISHQIVGIDTNEKAIQYSESLKSKLSHSNDSFQKIKFQSETLEEKLKTEEAYDVIIGGFYMPPSLHDNLLSRLEYSFHQNQSKTCGIWPTDSQSGQSLYSFVYAKDSKKDKKIIKNQIMSTMFSMPVVKTGVSKYFVEDGEHTQNENSTKQQTVNQEEVRQQLKILKMQKNKEQKQKIKNQLKQKISYYSLKLNKKLSLEEMKKIPEICTLLQKLNQK